MIKIKIRQLEDNVRFIRRFKKMTRLQRSKFREKEFFIKPAKRRLMNF